MARPTCPLCRETHHRLGRAPILASLAAGPRRIARAVAGARSRRLRRRPAPREWSVVEVLARRGDPRTILAAFTALRADTVALVRRLTPAQRRAAGRHSEYGRVRIDQLLDHWAEHDLIDLEQIRATLRAPAPRA